MIKETRSGTKVLFPFRPLPIGLVFSNEGMLEKARMRYWIALVLLLVWAGSLPLWLYGAPAFESSKHYIGLSLLALSIVVAWLVLYLVMPERTLYKKELHGPLP